MLSNNSCGVLFRENCSKIGVICTISHCHQTTQRTLQEKKKLQLGLDYNLPVHENHPQTRASQNYFADLQDETNTGSVKHVKSVAVGFRTWVSKCRVSVSSFRSPNTTTPLLNRAVMSRLLTVFVLTQSSLTEIL